MADKTTRDSDKFMLRLPDGMREAIKAAADANHRSMNAEIVAALEARFIPGPENALPEPWLREVPDDVKRAIKQLEEANNKLNAWFQRKG